MSRRLPSASQNYQPIMSTTASDYKFTTLVFGEIQTGAHRRQSIRPR
jgi:hypothetical protein